MSNDDLLVAKLIHLCKTPLFSWKNEGLRVYFLFSGAVLIFTNRGQIWAWKKNCV
jgi:hypothetical protein